MCETRKILPFFCAFRAKGQSKNFLLQWPVLNNDTDHIMAGKDNKTSKTNPKHKPLLLTPKETAEYLKVNLTTLNKWNNEGTGPIPYKPPHRKKVYYFLDEVIRWIKSGCPEHRQDSQ